MPSPKPKTKSAMVSAKSPPPKIRPINPREEPLKQFVLIGEYEQIRDSVYHLWKEQGITLRQIWAVVDHLVSVNDGREVEVNYAASTEATHKPVAGDRLSKR